jgi:protein phosphatase
VHDLIDSGQLTEEQAVGHPDANKITRALGMLPEVEVEVRPEPMELFPGDLFVLATDGLTDLVPADDILSVTLAAIEHEGAQAACDRLVALANERGGHDNITVQLVRVRATGPMRATTLAQEPSGLADAAAPDEPGVAAAGSPTGRGEGTVPDDAGPTMVEPTRPDDPASGSVPLMPPVAPEPVGPTVLQQPRGKGVPTTAPDRPLPTVVDPALAAAPVVPLPIHPAEPPGLAFGAQPLPMQHGTPAVPSRFGERPMVYLVLLMAVVIGVLAVALGWILLGR